jgi:hypothetical protein
MHFDAEIQQLEAWLYAAVCYTRHIYLVFIRHDKDAVPFLVRNECIEGNGGLCLFLPQEEAAAIGGGGFEGEVAGCADGSKFGLQGKTFAGPFISAAAFARKSQSHYSEQQGTDDRLAHQFPHRYGSWFLHSNTNVVKKIGYFLTAYHLF